MDINLELYKIFYHVVKCGTISKASEELFISQPAVSQAVKNLEEKLKGKLFQRTSKGMKLTPEGEVLYRYIEPGYNMIQMAENKFFEAINLGSGEIRIGASDMTLKFFILPYLEKFHKIYPGVRIKVTNGPTPETIQHLKNGMIDFGVVSGPVKRDPSLEVQDVMEIRDTFIANYKFAHLAKGPVSLKELSQNPLIMLEKNTSTREYVDNFASLHSVKIVPEIELATSDLLVQFAKRGLGIACVVRNFAREDIEAGNLFEVDLIEKIPPRKICIIKHGNHPLSAAAVRFTDLVD